MTFAFRKLSRVLNILLTNLSQYLSTMRILHLIVIQISIPWPYYVNVHKDQSETKLQKLVQFQKPPSTNRKTFSFSQGTKALAPWFQITLNGVIWGIYSRHTRHMCRFLLKKEVKRREGFKRRGTCNGIRRQVVLIVIEFKSDIQRAKICTVGKRLGNEIEQVWCNTLHYFHDCC